MLEFLIADPRDNWRIKNRLSFEGGGLMQIRLALNFQVAHKLEIDINPNIGYVYDDLVSRDDYGIIIRESDHNGKVITQLGFIRGRDPQPEYLSGRIKIVFLSAVYRLSNSLRRFLPNNLLYNGSAQNLVAQIGGSQVALEGVSADDQIEFDTGILNNFDLLNEVVSRVPGWSWVDAGINPVTNINQIKFGDFTSLFPKYTARIPEMFDPYDTKTLVILQEPDLDYNNDQVTFLKAAGVYSETVNGENQQKFIHFTKKYYDFLNPLFPLVDIGETDTLGNTLYAIQNTQAYQFTNYETFKNFEFGVTANSEDVNGDKFISKPLALRTIYQEAVKSLQEKNYISNIKLKLRTPSLLLPGTPINIRLQNNIKTFNSIKKPLAEMSDVVGFISNIEYDLSSTKDGLVASAQVVSNTSNRPPSIGQSPESYKLAQIDRERTISMRK